MWGLRTNNLHFRIFSLAKDNNSTFGFLPLSTTDCYCDRTLVESRINFYLVVGLVNN